MRSTLASLPRLLACAVLLAAGAAAVGPVSAHHSFAMYDSGRQVTIEGAVKNTGVFPLKGRTSLMHVIAMSGGVDANVASSTVGVFRLIDGKKSAARFDLDEIRAGKASDPELVPGDLVIVESSSAKVLFNNFAKVLPVASVFRGL